MPNIFDENQKIYNDEVSVNLSRKIFGDAVKCCLEAAKNNEKCQYFDTRDHKYSRKVSNSLDEVKDVCELLCMSPIFLNSFARSSIWEKYFNQSSYMKYHIENWYINVIRLEDMILVMINDIFQLGIKKELIGYEIISSNENLTARVKLQLKGFHKAVKPVRAARIMLIHHQTLYEAKLDEIRKDETIVKIIRDGGDQNEDTELEKQLRIMEFFTKKFKVPAYRNNKRDYILSSNKAMLRFVADFLKDLEKDFESKHRALLIGRKSELSLKG